MGWPRDNYLRRQGILIQQIVNQEKMKQNAKIEEANEIVARGEDKTDDQGGANGAVESTPDAGAELEIKAEERANEIVAQGEDKTDDEGGAKGAVEAIPDAGAETLTLAEGVTIRKDDPRILPLLSAPIDPETLLARLNNRRLYARILHYKREQRKKLQKKLEDEIKELDGFGSMKEDDYEAFSQAVKEQKTADRIYRKNMTIKEMAELEWDELLEMGNLRLRGEKDPYYPVPTQHELLLFSQCPREVGVLASYPRSGNSLMRTLYEHTTLRVTGSDMQGGLAKHDLVGECAVDAKFVQFVKTHFPERQGNPQFRASRVVLLVRNPFDAIESYFNLMMTGKHTDSITPEIRAKAAKYWEEYVLKEIRVWKLFHKWWLEQDVPLLLIRYEDLVRWPDKVMGRVLKFVLEVKRMDTFFDERISRCISDQQRIERMGSYKPRSGGIGKSLSKFSPELLSKLKSDNELRQVMNHLEYTELLEKPPEEWHTLTALSNFAHEYTISWEGSTTVKKVVFVNNPQRLVRTNAEFTPWHQIKNDLGVRDDDCDCAKCRAKKELKKADGDNVSAEAGEKEAEGDNFSAEAEEKNEVGARDSNDFSKVQQPPEPMPMDTFKREWVEIESVKLTTKKKEDDLPDVNEIMKAVNIEWVETAQANDGKRKL
ncbi:hypothetical protein ACHAW5_010561 [Stephanodiscus triporus]|uniref:Sulfotransferase domain-containing protein n=1 Tax=Stephanodiscus triporus TaxID=2934178 RepID=A0ABD3PL11_9STRA